VVQNWNQTGLKAEQREMSENMGLDWCNMKEDGSGKIKKRNC
jgi:hypothetical protein